MKPCKQLDGRSFQNDDPNKGIFTRRRSEIFLHRTRSGRARPDPAKRSQLLPKSRSFVSIPKEEGLGDSSAPAVVRGSIKDLRARRVFSLRASSIECLQMGDADAKLEVDVTGNETGDAAVKVKIEVSGDRIVDSTANKGVDANGHTFLAQIDAMEQDKAAGGGGGCFPIPADVMEEDNVADVGVGADAAVVTGGVGGEPGGVDVTDGSDIESTPPGREGFLDQCIVEEGPAAPSGAGSRTDGIFDSENVTAKCKEPSPPRPFRNRPGLVPCSRMKLFSAPNSHCYRRLLPYIMDLTKSNSSTLEIIPVSSQGRRLKSVPVERTTPMPLARLPPEVMDTPGKQSGTEGLETDSDASKRALLPKKPEPEVTMEISQHMCSTSASHILLESELTVASQSEQQKSAPYKQCETSIMETPGSDSIEERPITVISPDSPFSTDGEYNSNIQDAYNPPLLTESTQCNFITPSREYEPLPKFIGSPPDRKDLSLDEFVGCVQPTLLLEAPPPVPKNEECWQGSFAKSDVQAIISSGICNSGQLSPVTNCSLTPIKSILKRSVVGCKGLCTCLDCASFRLNAERAFEFSRRQFLEADNIAETLMKELSCLRNTLLTSAASICTSDKLRQVQVHDVCRKASDAETTARNRLREMESDLHSHCRISRFLRHKVTFAGPVEDVKRVKL